ncbi:flagellar basal body L-ring protein FlgH [Brevundimonas sp. BAL450]|uniref:Flagellar L-ring protein n=1 Tax=Brevundimonas abyssalis TAR-001 TaxID=1391729 RepID=A0A8E0NAT0_9CAUL|nr:MULTISPECIES: flagellar basal body L-ring protein FlgH [Brevundimonas]MBG7615930.1 flagellar basal body L-ring protein FlgH [Brevundimonas sp. BAL450]GAD58786.1 flagellar L-ring protein flgH [Brevundimonas abyssalis TAR-001]
MRKALVAIVPLALLGACSTAMEAVRGPELAPIGYPAALVPATQQILPAPETRPASANSIWRSGSRTFFGDQRARNVGDILTVAIDIRDRAQTQNSTQRSRSNEINSGVTNFFGLEAEAADAIGGAFDPSALIGFGGGSTSAGSGSVSRSENINVTIAAVVTAVMPNGNMVIQGRQEVRTNREVRELTVAGIVRPEDISSANIIRHDQIAEARIHYGGRGDISRVQGAPAAQSLVERFNPF